MALKSVRSSVQYAVRNKVSWGCYREISNPIWCKVNDHIHIVNVNLVVDYILDQAREQL